MYMYVFMYVCVCVYIYIFNSSFLVMLVEMQVVLAQLRPVSSKMNLALT